MNRIKPLAAAWEWAAGGPLPMLRHPAREVYVSDGAAYSITLVWWWRGLSIKYSTPRTPRKVRQIRDADRRRSAEISRRALAGEPLVKVGDIIPHWADAFLKQVHSVHDAEGTLWKRAEGQQRYARTDPMDEPDQETEYDWIAWSPSLAGWGSGWTTDEGLLMCAPLKVLKLRDRRPAGTARTP